jgi:hypothetical protein
MNNEDNEVMADYLIKYRSYGKKRKKGSGNRPENRNNQNRGKAKKYKKREGKTGNRTGSARK